MRIKMKRFLSILLSLVLVLGLMPGMSLTAYAADEVSENISLVASQSANLSTISGTHYSVSCGYMTASDGGMTVNSAGALTINARKGETITKVVLSYSWGNNKGTLSASAGTFDGNATISDINAQQVTISSSSAAGVRISAVTVYFEGSLSNPTVTLTGGANATSSGGLLTQSYLPGAMDTVTYTALTGATFPEFEKITQNGITVERTSETVVTVSGMPTANTEITVPDAESSSKIVTWGSSVINNISGNYTDTTNGITLTQTGDGDFRHGDIRSYGSLALNFTTTTGKFSSIEIVASTIYDGGNWTKDGNKLKWNGTPSNSVSLSSSGYLYLDGVSSINFVIEMPADLSNATVTLGADNTVSSVTVGGNEITDFSEFDITYGTDDSHTATTPPTADGTYYAFVAAKFTSENYIGTAKSAAFSISSHAHSFTYTADGATITATCSADGCTLTDSKATLTIAAPTMTTYGQTGEGISASATLTGLSDFNAATGKTIAATDIKYVGRDSTTYAESTTAPTDAGKYTAKITVEDKTASVDYEIAKADPTATAPTATATYGQTLADVTLTNPDGNTAGTWSWADATTTSVGTVGDHSFKANFTPTDTTNYNSKSNVDVTVTVGKAANPATVTGIASVTKGGNTVNLANNVTLNGATGAVSYEISGEANGCSLNGSVLTSGSNTGSVTVNVTVAGDANYNALAATPITVSISDKGTQTITAENVTATYGDTDKKVTATTDGNGAISYAVKDGSGEYIDVNSSTGALTIKKVPADNKAYVIVTAAETSTYAQATKEVTVTINKANPTVTAPTAKTLTYNGQAQALVNAGSVTDGTLYYAVTTENVAPTDDNLYTTSIPTKTDVGTYYVWYKVKGDDNHNDVDPTCVEAKINPVDKTSLDSAISAAETYYNQIKDNADYADIASALKTAIDNATAVKNNANVTTDAVTTSVTTINTAKSTAEAGVKDVDDTKAANAVIAKINALPASTDVTADNEATIKAAREAYTGLTEDQQKKISAEILNKLTAAETALNTLNTNAAKDVTDAITALPAAADVNDSDEAAIKAARAAYDKLTDTQKGLVSDETLAKLTVAEESLGIVNTDTAKEVTDAINALPASDKVAASDEAAIKAARAAYDKLTDTQKGLVSDETLAKLTVAETALNTVNTNAAKAVTDAINALPASDKVTVSDEAAIKAARAAYDKLTDTQKKLVSKDTLKKLTDAEDALAAAEKKVAEDEAAKKAAAELEAAKAEAQAAMNEQVTVTQKGKKFTVKWKKASSADGYYVYAQYCGKKIKKPVKTITKNTTTKTTITKINGKKINQKKQFRVYVVPYKIIDGKKVTLGKSTVAHLVGSKNTKYSNVKKLTLNKSKYTVKVGKTAKIKAKVTLVNKNKKHIPKSHGAKFRYKSSDTSIATVDKNGKIKGIKKGTCTIYVYSINGLMKKAKVTVK